MERRFTKYALALVALRPVESSGLLQASSTLHLKLNSFVQQLLGFLVDEQSVGGFLKCCKVWDAFQLNRLTERFAVDKILDKSSIIGSKKILEHQASE